MSSEQMKARISAQPESLRKVLEYQCGPGADALLKAAALIGSRRQVVITGMGASYYAALPLESYLCRLGMNAIAVEAGELLHFRSNAYRDSVVVAVSRSGESIEIAKLLIAMKGKQPIIGITNLPESSLARGADVAISIQSQSDDIVALQTYTGTLLALALLGSAVVEELARAKSEVEGFLPAFEERVASSLGSTLEWDEFLSPGTSLYLLARGGSYGSALEGALLFHEVAKASAVAMPTASFRHGPVEVVDANFRAFIFAPQDTTQPLNAALAQDLVRFGGQVRVIGPADQNLISLPLLETPKLNSLFAPTFEIVPVQAAALRLAEIRDIVPGGFRFAPPVALDEASFGQL